MTSGGRGAVSLAATILLPTAYGAVIEAAQLLVPPRSAEPLDLLANLLGALVGAAALTTINHKTSRLGRDGP
jgi:VanZ family protein